MLSRAALKAFAKQKNDAIVKISLGDCDDLSNDFTQQGHLLRKEHSKVQQSHDKPLKGVINFREEVDTFQKNLISLVLSEENGRWSEAAKRLNTDRANLNRLAKRLGIQVTKVID